MTYVQTDATKYNHICITCITTYPPKHPSRPHDRPAYPPSYYMHADMHTSIHAYIHTCIHTYMHTYIHTYIHTCDHASTGLHKMSDSLNVSLSLSLPLCSRLDLVNLVPELGSNVMTFPGELVQVSPQTPKPILNVTVQLSLCRATLPQPRHYRAGRL